MTDSAKSSPQPEAVIPADGLQCKLTVAYPDSPRMRHVSIAGDTYTILVSGVETAGRYCLIDMHVPAGGGPPPHRHNFEEMFTLLEGELEFTFRGETSTVHAGSTVNIPANAPHAFKNASGAAVRMLCRPHRPGWKHSSWRSVILLIVEPLLRRSSHQRKSASGRKRRRRCRQNTISRSCKRKVLDRNAGQSFVA